MSYTTGHRAIAVGAIASAALLGAASASSAAELNAVEKKLAAAAKAEGEVTIIHPLFSDRTGQNMQKAFVERYGLGPNFKLNSLRKGTGATVAQVRQEIQAGKFTIDAILVSSPGFFAEAAKRGAFDTLESGYWKEQYQANIDAAGQFAQFPYVVTPLYYTFQPVWNTSCPGMEKLDVTSYSDVIKADLKGKTISSDITKSFTYTNTVISLKENLKWDDAKFWADLKKTDPIVEFRTEPKMQMVISCERPLDMWNLSGRVYQNVIKQPDLKDKIKIGYYKEGQVALGNQVAVLKGAPHPNAAKLLIEFLLSKEGTDVYVEGEAVGSFRKGYKPPAAAAPYLTDFEAKGTKLIGQKDWVASAKEFKTVREEWQKNFR